VAKPQLKQATPKEAKDVTTVESAINGGTRKGSETKMAQTQTSRESYRKLSPEQVKSESNRILAVFQTYPEAALCDRFIADETGIAINIVESRRNRLFQKKKINWAGVMYYSPTKRMVQTWKLTSSRERGGVAESVKI
jgi:hypothetical protein